MAGKTRCEPVRADDADGLRVADQEVWNTGKPDFVHEFVTKSTDGQSTVNVCTFIGDFEGTRHVFGLSFIIDEGTRPSL